MLIRTALFQQAQMALGKDLGRLFLSTNTRAIIWSQCLSSTAVHGVTGKEYARPGMIAF